MDVSEGNKIQGSESEENNETNVEEPKQRRSRRKPNVTRHITHSSNDEANSNSTITKQNDGEVENGETLEEDKNERKRRQNEKKSKNIEDSCDEAMEVDVRMEGKNGVKKVGENDQNKKDKQNLISKNSVKENKLENNEVESDSEKKSEDKRGTNKEQSETKKLDEDELMIRTNSDGVSTLPDGTIVIQPESVSDNEFKGPEFRRKRNRGTDSDVVRCTSCSTQLNPDSARNLYEHPSLKVIICKKCYKFYTSGSFTKDADDIDEQCHWCGEGGKLICCDFCTKVFCRACILRNLGREELSNILNAEEDNKWKCYSCDTFQLNDLQKLCSNILYPSSCSKNIKSDKIKSSLFIVQKHTEAMANDLKLNKIEKFKTQHQTSFMNMTTKSLENFVENIHTVRGFYKSLEKNILDYLESLSSAESEDSENEQSGRGKARKQTEKKPKKLQNGNLSDLKKRITSSPRKLKTTPISEGRQALSSENESSHTSSSSEFVKKNRKEKKHKGSAKNEPKKNERNNLLIDSSDDSLLEFDVEKSDGSAKQDNGNVKNKERVIKIELEKDVSKHLLFKKEESLLECNEPNTETLKNERKSENVKGECEKNEKQSVDEENVENERSNENMENVCSSTGVGEFHDSNDKDAVKNSHDKHDKKGKCEKEKSKESEINVSSKIKEPCSDNSLSEVDGRQSTEKENKQDKEECPNGEEEGKKEDSTNDKQEEKRKVMSEKTKKDKGLISSSAEEDSSDSSLLEFDEKKNTRNKKNKKEKLHKKERCSNGEKEGEEEKDTNSKNDDTGSESDSELEKFIANQAKKKKKRKRRNKMNESDKEAVAPEQKEQRFKKLNRKSKRVVQVSDLDISSSDLSDATEQRRKEALEKKEKIDGQNIDGSDQEMMDLENKVAVCDGRSDVSITSDMDLDKIAKKMVLEEMEAEEAGEGITRSDDNSGDDKKKNEDKKKNTSKSSKGNDQVKESKSSSDEQEESDSESSKKKKKVDELKNDENYDDDDEKDEISDDDTDSDTGKRKKKKSHRLMRINLKESTDSSEEDNESKREKRANRRAKILERKRKRKSSDSSNSTSESNEKRKHGKRKKLAESLTSSDESVDTKKTNQKRGKNSDSSASVGIESSEEEVKPLKKRGRRKKKDDESSQTSGNEKTGRKRKKKRRRIKLASDSSENESEDDDEKEKKDPLEPDTPKGKGRRNIRKVMKDSKLKEETKAAAQLEIERRRRVAEKRKEVIDESDEKPQESSKVTACVLEYDKKKEKVLLEVDESIAQHLKPHQVKGIQFLWDSTYESLEKLNEAGGGCILAHCMGLGKTLQVISYIHTVMSVENIGAKHCLVVAPLNTVLNWVSEFEKWLGEESEIPVYEMSSIKDNWGRADALRFWHANGGVMIIGYTMYRNLSTGARIRKKSLKKIFFESLTDPGPDIVVCDEGHTLKNEQTAISKALNQVKTRRRICLTGTPLQNNLIEYHCMVDFVKPSLLGTKKEFCNRFVNPITNGQSSDASRHDVRVMKRRAHVLHEMLSGCVQRRDYSALSCYLPPKHEFVVSVRLSKVQIELYEKYLNSYARVDSGDSLQRKGMGLFADYQSLMRIWTHPWVLRLSSIRDIKKARYDDEMSDFITSGEEIDSGDSLVEFIDDNKPQRKKKEWRNSESSDSEDELMAKVRRKKNSGDEKSDSSVEVVNTWKTRSRTRNKCADEPAPEEVIPDPGIPGDDEWYSTLVPEDCKNNLEMSGKLLLLMEILKLSEMVGDKVLVFSQSLLSLDLIEDFLVHIEEQEPQEGSEEIAGNRPWVKGVDYFRMDGSTQPHMRTRWADIFNDPENLSARLFLISTRAGSLGTNLVAANRVILFDASWNPSHDIQSIFRVYRFGQTKAVYIYRLVAQGTMEEKIYERQVTKQSLSQRVVDEHQIERHFSASDLSELYNFTPDRLDDPNRPERPTPQLPKDFVLAELLKSQADWIVKYHEHDSLLENKVAEELTEEERKEAWKDYEAEKEGRVHLQMNANMHPGFQAANAEFMQRYGPLLQQSHSTLMAGQQMLNPMLMQQQYAHATHPNMYNMPNIHQLNQQKFEVQQKLMAMRAAIDETRRQQRVQALNAQQQAQASYGVSVKDMLNRMKNLSSSSTSSPTIVEILDDDDPPAGHSSKAT